MAYRRLPFSLSLSLSPLSWGTVQPSFGRADDKLLVDPCGAAPSPLPHIRR